MMTQITQINQENEIQTAQIRRAGQAANKAARRNVFSAYVKGLAPNTERRIKADIALFETFLNAHSVPAYNLLHDPEAWQEITFGLVEAFKAWQEREGYALGTINGRIATVRKFAAEAEKAGAIPSTEARLIQSVKGYSQEKARNVDKKRKAAGLNTRMSSKKAQAVTIPADIAQAMTEPGTSDREKRDSLLMCLLLDHGLRIGEAAALTRDNFDMKAGTLVFYRSKVDKTQTHELTPATLQAAREYLPLSPKAGIIWRRSYKGSGNLTSQMSEVSATRALTKRVLYIGRTFGIDGLSAHDCRHYWATYEARNNTPLDRLMDAGGWNSSKMPLRYIESAAIANEGTAKISKKG